MIRRYWYERVEVRERHGVPHWQVREGIYFLTWRLAGSIPLEQEVALDNLRAELSRLRAMDAPVRSIDEAEREHFRLLERALDAGGGTSYMSNPAVADIVAGAFEYGNGKTHDLITYAVMPNHVHVVFRLKDQLDDLVHRWKSFTAHTANDHMGRHGGFWADGYFDVLIRNSRQLERTVSYVRLNPAKAELFEWRWVWFSAERYAELI